MAKTGMDFTVEIDNAALKIALAKAPAVTHEALQDWVSRSTLRAERAEKRRLTQSVSKNSSGRTLNSIKSKIEDLKGEAKPDVKYSYYVVHGRKPGKMPPSGPGTDLAAWARRAGVNPFVVARSIARNGTKGIPFIEEAYNDIRSDVFKDGNDVLNNIIKGI